MQVTVIGLSETESVTAGHDTPSGADVNLKVPATGWARVTVTVKDCPALTVLGLITTDTMTGTCRGWQHAVSNARDPGHICGP